MNLNFLLVVLLAIKCLLVVLLVLCFGIQKILQEMFIRLVVKLLTVKKLLLIL